MLCEISLRTNDYPAKMIVVALRCFFFFAVITAYSTGVWKLINGYFGKEFQMYMERHPVPSAPPSRGEVTGGPTKATILEAALKATAPEEFTCGRDDFRQRQEKNGLMDDMTCRVRSTLDNVHDKAMDDRVKDQVAAADGDLITSALNHHSPIDETWWSNYYTREEREKPLGRRSRSMEQPYDNGEWSKSSYCSAGKGEPEEEEEEECEVEE